MNYNSWAYQLQNINIEELQSSNYDILVIDYSKEGDDSTAFSSTEIELIHNGKPNRKVISYISIGEAEDYRSYFNQGWIANPPDWFDGENPDWEGNYKVKFWYQEWKNIIFEYLDKLLKANFDGAYLDIIDAYEFYEENGIADADNKMIEFVGEISNYTKSKNNEFLIIPQNGEQLLSNKFYRQIIDGIGREEVYVIATNEKRDQKEIIAIEEKLDLLTSDDKLVLVVDYANTDEMISYATSNAAEKGYISFITDVDLDNLGPKKIQSVNEDTIFPVFISLPTLILIVITKYFRNNKSIRIFKNEN